MNKPNVHFIGIGGIGTSALARWFLTQGYKVSGSDISASLITNQLKKEGVKIYKGHKAGNLSPSIRLIIHSVAVNKNNPEIEKAHELGIPVQTYAQALGDLTKKYKTIAVAGAHGKSTTTALLSLVLIKAGFDPTVIIGAKLKEFGNSNFRKGNGKYLILEADEYHQSFLNYSPIAAIITNIDREHLDYYKNLAKIKNVFLKFIENIRPNGILVLNKDDKNLSGLKNKIQKIAKNNNLELCWYSITLDQRSQTQCNKLRNILNIPGKHNVSNALAVYTLAKALKTKDKDIFNAISRYQGAWRRMEHRGQLKTKSYKLKADVYDDYAHHPTEIKATLSALREKYPKSKITKIICVFQPHQAERLKRLFKEFIGAFDNTNALILLPIFLVRGRDKVSHNISSEKLAKAIRKHIKQLKTNNQKLKTILYLPRPGKLRRILKNLIIRNSRHSHKFADSHYVIVMMGAGDIYKLTNKLIQ
jgi:UDP-N-acetylmuramate--alanine ligase